jgi:hypothetical protein
MRKMWEGINNLIRGVNVGGGSPPREMIQSVSNYVQSVSKLCVCLHAVLCEAN